MRILFLHGWHSVPGGVKPTYLTNLGHEVINPALDDDEFDAAVRIAQAAFGRHRPDVILGSSQGGAVAMNISRENATRPALSSVEEFGHGHDHPAKHNRPAQPSRRHRKRAFIAGPTVAGDLPDNWREAVEVGIDAILTDYPLGLRGAMRQNAATK